MNMAASRKRMRSTADVLKAVESGEFADISVPELDDSELSDCLCVIFAKGVFMLNGFMDSFAPVLNANVCVSFVAKMSVIMIMACL